MRVRKRLVSYGPGASFAKLSNLAGASSLGWPNARRANCLQSSSDAGSRVRPAFLSMSAMMRASSSRMMSSNHLARMIRPSGAIW